MSLLQMSISAGLLVIAIVLIRAVCLNKLPKSAFLMLWGVALFRLLVPMSISGQFSLYSAMREAVNSVSSHGTPALGWDGIIVLGQGAAGYTGLIDGVHTGISPIMAIWFVGMLAMFIFFAVVYLKVHHDLRFAMPIIGNAFLNDWMKLNKLKRPIAIMQSDRVNTPIASGLIKPRIILPKNMNIEDTLLLSHVLMHEYCHIKRLDALWKILMVAALCIHWFNPLVWVMFVLANRDLELTCDEMVLKHLGTETKTAYAYSIIGMAEQKNRFALLYNGFSKNAAAERIESIMKLKKTSLVSLILAFVLVASLSIGAFTVFAESPQTQPIFAPSEAALERLAAIIEEAGVAVLPYELRGRLPDFDESEVVSIVAEIDPEVHAWINEQTRARVPFLLFYPEYLLHDPVVYALVMEGASWSEIMDVIRAQVQERLEEAGHVYRVVTPYPGIPRRVFNIVPFEGELMSLLDYLIDHLNVGNEVFPFIFPQDLDLSSVPIFELSYFEGEVRFILPRD